MNINYIRIASINNKETKLYDRRDENKFHGKKKSEETKQTERLDAKYNSRRNRCTECFEAKSLNGTCSCS